LIKSEAEEERQEDLLVVKGGTETVLVAEDDASVRELIKEILLGYGYKVIEAEDGEDAVRRFKENKDGIRLLILDVIMPKKNGKKVYDDIMKERPDVKVIFMSGYDANVIHKKEFDFISKPISIEKLLRKIREVLDK